MSLKEGQEWTVSWMKSYKAHLKKETSTSGLHFKPNWQAHSTNDQESGGSCLTLMAFLIEGAWRAPAQFLERSFVSLNSLEHMHFVLGKDFLLETKATELGAQPRETWLGQLSVSNKTSIVHIEIQNWVSGTMKKKLRSQKLRLFFMKQAHVFVFI